MNGPDEENVYGPMTSRPWWTACGRTLATGTPTATNGAIDHSVAMKPHDPAFRLLLDDFRSVPVVHRDGCYICEDPEFAAMGLPLCFPCPACVRKQQACGACEGTGAYPDKTPCSDCLATGVLGGMGHIAADDTSCDDCEYEHGPDDYDEEGLITGIPRERALAIKDMRKRGSRG